ncbi:hypothetical protein ACFSZS_19810 [Seohaeicola zhoushanensis]
MPEHRLLDEVWPDSTGTTQDLTRCIENIRHALGQDMVQSAPDAGYLLVPPARRAAASPLAPGALRAGSAGDPGLVRRPAGLSATAPPGPSATPARTAAPADCRPAGRHICKAPCRRRR